MVTLAGKVAVITGGATGIGKALAQALATEGMRVVVASTSEERVAAAAEDLRRQGAQASGLVCDVADIDSVRRLADRAAAEHGPVDLLCANAGVTTKGSFLAHRQQDWDWVLDVVLKGATNCVQVFYPAMAARGSGHILLTGSQTALAPDWVLGHGPYVAAKAAVHALATALRAEAAEHGVGVSLLIPAATDTEIALSERSRQPRYGDALDGEITIRADAPAPVPASAMFLSPEEVARRAVAGIKANLPIIATHAGMRPLVEDYFHRILSAYDDAAAFPAGVTN